MPPTAAAIAKKKAEAEKAESERLEALYRQRVLAGGTDGENAIAELEKNALERYALDEQARKQSARELELAEALLQKHEKAIEEITEELASQQLTAAEHKRESDEQLEERERDIRTAADQLEKTKQEIALATAELHQAHRATERAKQAQTQAQRVTAHPPRVPAQVQPLNPNGQAQINETQGPPQQDMQYQQQAAIDDNEQQLPEPTLSATFNVTDKYQRLYSGKKEEDAKSHMEGYMDYVSNTLTAAPSNHPMRLIKLQIGRFRESLSGPARQWMGVQKQFISLQDLRTRFLERFGKYHSTGDDLAKLNTPMKPGTSVEAFADRLKASANRLKLGEELLGSTLLANLPSDLKQYAMNRGAKTFEDIVKECKEMERNGPSRKQIATAHATSITAEHDFNTSLSAFAKQPEEYGHKDELLEGMKNILQYVSIQEDRGRQRWKSPAPGKGQIKSNNSGNQSSQKGSSKDRNVQFQDQSNSGGSNGASNGNSQGNSKGNSRNNSKDKSQSNSRGNSKDRGQSQNWNSQGNARSQSQEWRDSQKNSNQGNEQPKNNFQGNPPQGQNNYQGNYQGNNYKGNNYQGNNYQGGNRNQSQQSNNQNRGNPGYFGKGNGCFNCGDTDHYWRNCEKPRRDTFRMDSERNGLRAYFECMNGGSGDHFHHSSK